MEAYDSCAPSKDKYMFLIEKYVCFFMHLQEILRRNNF